MSNCTHCTLIWSPQFWCELNDVLGCQEQAGAAAGVAAASAPEYMLEEMTFQMEDEKIPEYKPPKSDDEDELLDNDGTEEAGESCCVSH